VVADLALGVGVAGVEAGTEIVVTDVGVGQQVPDDGQDGAADRDDGFLRAAAAGDAAVALAEGGVGVAGGDGGLAENPGQVGVAVTGAAGAFLFPGGFGDSGCELRPGAQVSGGGNRSMSSPVAAMATCAAVRPTPVISSSCSTAWAKGVISSSILASTRPMSAVIASTRASIVDNRNA
jgi:hypothetical protein